MKMVNLGIKDTVLKSMIEAALLEREKLNFKIKELTARKEQVTSHILSLIGTYRDFWEGNPLADELIAKHPFLKFMIDSNSEPTIGDAAFEILSKHGTMPKKKLLSELAQYGIEISEKNASTILGTALRRDNQMRFEILKDGNVTLGKRYAKK